MPCRIRRLRIILGVVFVGIASLVVLGRNRTELAFAVPPATADHRDGNSVLAQARARGIADARADIAAGKLVEFVFSTPPSPVLAKRVRVLKSFGIETRFAGDVLNRGVMEYVAAYDAIMDEHIEKRLGKDIWQRVDRAVAQVANH